MSIPQMPPLLSGELGGSFDSALGSVGAPTTNTVAGFTPPPPETIELVLSSQAIFAAQQTMIQVDQELKVLAEKLHTLETLLAKDPAFPSTLTRKQLQNLVKGGPGFTPITTTDQAQIEAAAAAVEDQISVLQLRGALNVKYEFK